MKNWIGVTTYLGGILACIGSAALLYSQNLMGSWFPATAMVVAVLFSQLISWG